jgi:aspartate racemase
MRPKLILGVLGGMGPAATADFLRLLAEKAPASCDQEHPEMFVYSNTITPDRTTYLLGKGPDPRADIKRGVELLNSWGADVLAVTCNTAHYFLDELVDKNEMPLHLIHIIDETIKAAARISPKGAWLTATMGTMKTGLYQKHAEKMGYEFKIPSMEQKELIHHITDLVKGGKCEEAGRLYKGVIEELWREEDLPIVCACTELPIAYEYTKLDKTKGISCLGALADACISYLYNPNNN